jgi:hypothetical protein
VEAEFRCLVYRRGREEVAARLRSEEVVKRDEQGAEEREVAGQNAHELFGRQPKQVTKKE